MFIEPIAVGLFTGIIWSALGYAVAKAKNNEDFNPEKFAKTLVIGIVLATASKGLGVDIAHVEGMSVVGFLTAIVDKITSLLIKK